MTDQITTPEALLSEREAGWHPATADEVLDEVERRLRNTGWSSEAEDRCRTALLHIDAYRTTGARAPDRPSDLAALRTGNARERVAAALYDGNEAFHATLAHERGQEYQRIVRPPWADTNEYYRALYRARADAALAALGITVTDPDPDAVRVAVHSMLDLLGAETDDPEDGAR